MAGTDDSFDAFLQTATQRVARDGASAGVDVEDALRSLELPASTEQATARVKGILDDLLR